MKKLYLSFLFIGLFFSINVLSQTITPISEVQGENFLSPLVEKEVTVQGIVTAIRKSGFYIQTPDDKVDGNPKTSEGIYIFTKNEPSSDITVGNLVEVKGIVAEYRSERESYSLFLTEIIEPKVKIISKENTLPKPYVLTEADLKPGGNPDQLERFEGMILQIEELKVVAPTGGFLNNKEEKIVSDGAFYGVLAKTSRPFREPGLDVLKVLFDKMPATLSVFDMNAELIRVDSDGLTGGEPIDVAAGATLKNLVGVLDYTFSAYTLLLDPKIKPFVENSVKFIKASPAADSEITVASFNIENFFDDEENSDLEQKEEKVSKDFFEKRLKKTSLAIREVVSLPDVLGIVEVENLEVLKKLAERINKDAENSGQTNPKYEAFLEEGNDPRGIDVGFLIKTSKIKVKKVEQLFKDTKLEHKDANPKEKLFDRPPLLIEVEISSEKPKENFSFTVIVNHFKSYRGIDDPKDGDRVRTKRRLEAEFLAKFVQERQKANPNEPLILIGDFNAFQFNDGYNDLIGILKGNPSKNIVTPSKEIYETGLVTLVDYISPENRYSYVFGGSAQVLDHILINKPARSKAVKFGYARFNADFPKVYANDENRPERVSDHDVPVLYLSLKDKKEEEKKTENSATNQKSEKIDCPKISVTPPPTALNSGEPAPFTAMITGKEIDKYKMSYDWSVDKGRIISGQGTLSIVVSTEGLDDTFINATIKISGLPKECSNTASEASIPLEKISPILIDEFGKVHIGDIKSRIDNFLINIQNEPNSQGYIINYGLTKDATEREKFLKNYILLREFDLSKIVFINGGVEEGIRTRLWIVPKGVDPSGID